MAFSASMTASLAAAFLISVSQYSSGMKIEKIAETTEFGSTERGVWASKSGSIFYEYTPWVLNTELQDHVMLQVAYMTAVPDGEAMYPSKPESDRASDGGWLVTYKALRPSDGSMPVKPSIDKMRMMARATCENRKDDKHFRVLTFWGPARNVLKAKNSGEMTAKVKRLCRENPARAKKKADHDAMIVPPSKGVPSDQLVDVVHDMNLTIGADGYAQMRNTSYVLLKDGWAIRNPSIPMRIFDRKLSREVQAGKWFKWRKASKGYERLRDGKWTRISGDKNNAPLKKGHRLNDTYRNYDSGASYSTTRSITLRENGTYAVGSSSMMSSGMSDSSVYSTKSAGEDGCRSATSVSGGIVGGTRTSNASCGDGLSGTYVIDGYTITLSANNGVEKHFALYVLDKTVIIFGGREYSRSK